MDSFAIVGFSFKLAQDVADEATFWDVLQSRTSLMSEWPKDRANIDFYHDNGSKKKNTCPARGAHFWQSSVAAFDAPFFSITAQEAAVMDPQQRWALQTVYHAFESAGIPAESLKNSRTAVFGASASDGYSRMFGRDPDTTPRLATTGVDSSVLVGRISWYFGLRGPSLHINTACSSSLTAVDAACKSMRSGDATAAVVVGCNLMLDPETSVLLANQNFLSPDSLCYSFDERANGYSRGEGVLAMVIKPLETALADGDVIRSVIRSSACNQDGRTPSLTQPSAEAQERLIRHAYDKAGLELDKTRYFEAHGTGTPTGDPIEAKALGRVFRTHRSQKEPLFIGSVKGNFGHVEGGSGLAGIIKSTLSLEKGLIAPQALFERLNPNIDAEFFNLAVPTASIPWPTTGVRRASVNSFSLGGSNGHVVLDDALHFLRQQGREGYHNCTVLPKTSDAVAINGTTYSSTEHLSAESDDRQGFPSINSGARLLVWSAIDSEAVNRMVAAYQTYIRDQISPKRYKLDQLAYTLSNRRSRFVWRSFAVLDADDPAPAEVLAAISKRGPVRSSNTKLSFAFVFTGQGAQYAQMGKGLLQYNIFMDTLTRADKVFASLGSDWSLFDILDDGSRINNPLYSQPLCTVLQIALVELLSSIRVIPTVVIGHSSGEIAAAYALGTISLETACKIAFYRGVVAEELKATSAIPGAMLSVNLSEAKAMEYLRQNSHVAHVACVNSPENCTLSGELQAIETIQKELEARGVFAQKVNTGVAYHSPAMHKVSSHYRQLLGDMKENYSSERGNVSMISSVTGGLVVKNSMLSTAQYWVDNLVSTVRFTEAVQGLTKRNNLPAGADGLTDILEVGPHAALRRPIQDNLAGITASAAAAASETVSKAAPSTALRYHSVLHRSKLAEPYFLELIGTLFCHGHDVSISTANHQDTSRIPPLVDCPKYPFDLTRKYWTESRLSRDLRLRPPAHGLLIGKRSHDWNSLQPSFRNWLSIDNMPWLEDHVVTDKVVCPGTGLVLLALEGIRNLHQDSTNGAPSISAFLVKEAHFLRPLSIPDNVKSTVEVILSLRPQRQVNDKEDSLFQATIFSYDDNQWVECFRATIQIEHDVPGVLPVDGGKKDLADTQRIRDIQQQAELSCQQHIDSKTFYGLLRDHGIAYGPSFTILSSIQWDGDSVSQATIKADAMLDGGGSPAHPAVLDAALHLVMTQLSNGAQGPMAAYVPHMMHNLWISSKIWKEAANSSVRVTSKIEHKSASGCECSTVVTEDFNGNCTEAVPLLSLQRGFMTPVSTSTDDSEDTHDVLYRVDRKPLLSQLSKSTLQTLCGPKDMPVDPIEQSWLDGFETAMREATQLALYNMKASNFDMASLPSHLRTFINTFTSRYGVPDIPAQKEHVLRQLDECEAYDPAWTIYTEAGRHIEAMIRNEIDPLDILVSSTAADLSYSLLFDKVCDQRLFNFMELATHEKPNLRILEIGAGTGGLTRNVISILEDLERRTGSVHFSEYTYTDISPAFFESARSKFASVSGRLVFQKLDIEKNPELQGFDPASYDLIFCGSVLHDTTELHRTLTNIHSLLKPKGHLLAVEIVETKLVRSLVGFGALPGWWYSTEQWRQDGPLATAERWDSLMRDCGFSGIEASFNDKEGFSMLISSAIEVPRQEAVALRPNTPGLVIVVDANKTETQNELAEKLSSSFCASTRIITFSEVTGSSWHKDDVVISLIEGGSPVLSALSEWQFEALHALVSQSQNLLWVSFPALSDSACTVDAKFNTAQGFFRSIRYEEPGKRLITLTSGYQPNLSLDALERHICTVLGLCFLKDSIKKSSENEFIIQDGTLCIERLVAAPDQEQERCSRIYPSPQQQLWKETTPVQLSVKTRGMLDTLQLTEVTNSKPLGDNEVEIESRAWPVSFRDVLVALARNGKDDSGLGFEFAGVVHRVGSNVSTVKPGDRVVGGTVGAMQTYVRILDTMVFKIPDSVPFNRAAAALNPLMTAHVGLVDVARLQKGEKVLIHSAAGSTGQMAICVAKQIGAEIFATVGLDEKRDFLIEEFGIPEDHIFYSRNTSFLKGIMRVTEGYGVDVVLNSLAGKGLMASWDCIAPCGRFIEIGKADISANSALSMSNFSKNVTFSAVDLVHLVAHKPQVAYQAIRETLDLLSLDSFSQYPKPLHFFSVTEAEKAFRLIQSGKNTGRAIITIDPQETVTKNMIKKSTWTFDWNKSYLLVGGLGGIGRAIIQWMVEKGAKFIIAPSRSGASSQSALDLVQDLEQKGVKIATPRCQAGSSTELATVLEDCSRTMPPVKGAINCAMSLQDSIFENMMFSQWQDSIQAKVGTTWDLHSQLPLDLDFFIMLSSVASIFGSPGQSNYAAGCAYQDAIAGYRASLGYNSVSLNISLVADVGVIKDQGRQINQNIVRNIKPVYARDILAVLDHYCNPSLASISTDSAARVGQLLINGITPGDTNMLPEHVHAQPFLAGFPSRADTTEQTGGGKRVVGQWALLFRQASSMSDRPGVVVNALVDKLAHALDITAENIDVQRPLSDYGVDSLMAVELRNWIKKDFAALVAVFDIVGNNVSITGVADLVSEASELKLPEKLS